MLPPEVFIVLSIIKDVCKVLHGVFKVRQKPPVPLKVLGLVVVAFKVSRQTVFKVLS
jgi:hypothetical protein